MSTEPGSLPGKNAASVYLCLWLCVCVCVCGVCACLACVCLCVCALFPHTLRWGGEKGRSETITENQAAHLGWEALSFLHEPDADSNQFNQWAMFAGRKNSPEVVGQQL